MNRQRRILGVLAVLLALNALYVVVVLWAFFVLLPTLTVAFVAVFTQGPAVGEILPDLIRMPVSLPTAAVLIVGFLLGQVYYGYQRVLSGIRPPAAEAEHDLSRLVGKLAVQADIPAPAVRVIESDEPSCYTVGRFGQATIVVTTGVIDRLDPHELEAVLAHELSHVANRDVTLMTITTLFLEFAERLYQRSTVVRKAITDPGDVSASNRLALRFFLPVAVLTLLFVAPILWVFPSLAAWATRQLSHSREFAADAGAARLTGNPLALATALTTLEEAAGTPQQDLRETGAKALCILPMEFVSTDEEAEIPAVTGEPASDRQESLAAWLDSTTPAQSTDSDTHPSVERRVERLRELGEQL